MVFILDVLELVFLGGPDLGEGECCAIFRCVGFIAFPLGFLDELVDIGVRIYMKESASCGERWVVWALTLDILRGLVRVEERLSTIG